VIDSFPLQRIKRINEALGKEIEPPVHAAEDPG
jgi:hypothetical protein